MALLRSISDNAHKYPLLVLQSSLAQSGLPVLRWILNQGHTKNPAAYTLLFCFLYQPSSLVLSHETNFLEVYDWNDRVPGYDGTVCDLFSIVEKALESPSRQVNIVLDSIDTFLSDKESIPETWKLLQKLFALVKTHPRTRLIMHSQSPCELLPLVTQTSFSSSLAHIIAHPPALLTHLATEFLMPPPPASPIPKFWGVFIPVSQRLSDTERLVFGPKGQGSSDPFEFVAEVIVRDPVGRKRGVERVLEGWSCYQQGPCELQAIGALRHLWKKQAVSANTADPTQDLPFNLSLTSSQQESRAQVPLPYAHEGHPMARQPTSIEGAIFYDPDSADDIDDDDPDEDLDI